MGINASQRKNGSSYHLLKAAFEGTKKEDKTIETEILQLVDIDIKPCKACYSGVEEVKYYGCAKKPHKCIIEDDDFEEVFQKMVEADGIIVCIPHLYSNPFKVYCLNRKIDDDSLFFK